MLPPGTPITFAGDSAGGSVRFALAKTDVTGHPSKTTPTVPGAYRMTISTGWVSATPRTTIIKPSFSAEIAVGTASPRSEPRVMIAVGRLGPTGSRIGISYRGRVVLPALVQNPPVDPDALVGPDLSARLRALTVPIGTRVVAVRGQISGGQLRAWTGADNSPASIGVKFDLLHGWLALVSGRYELSMAVQSPGSPQIWVTFMLNVEQGSQVTSSPGAPASDQAACAAAMASLVAHRAQLAADGKSAAKIAKAWPRVNESTCVVTSSGVVTFETSDGSRQITVSLNAGSSDSPQPASP
jgi:hypothetical protein